MIRALISVCLVAFAVGSAAGQPKNKEKIAILGLEVIGDIQTDVTKAATAFTQEMRGQARTPKSLFQIARDSEKDLAEEKAMTECKEEIPCMAQIGKKFNADHILWGTIERKTEAGQGVYVVRLQMLKVKDFGSDRRQWQQSIEVKDGLGDWPKRAYFTLTDPSAPGELTVSTPGVDTATLLIDGSEKGTITSGNRTFELPPGRYRVAIEASGFRRWEADDSVTVRPRDKTIIEAKLEKLGGKDGNGSKMCDPKVSECGGVVGGEGPKRGKWWALAIGGGILHAAGWAYMAKLEFVDKRECENKKDETGAPLCTDETKTDPAYQKGQRASDIQRYVLIPALSVTGVAMVVGVVGLIVKSGGSEKRVSSLLEHGNFVATPFISPDRAGFLLRYSW